METPIRNERRGLLLFSGILTLWLLIRVPVATPWPPAEAILVAATTLALFTAHATTRRHCWAVPAVIAGAITVLVLVAGPDAVHRHFGPVGYSNASAGLYTIGVGAACLVAVRAGALSVRVLFAVAAVGLSVLPFLIESIAAAGGTVVILLATLLVTVRPRAARPLVTLAGLGTVLVFLATLVMGATFIDTGGDPSDGLLSQRRLTLWSEALDLIVAEPVVGVGIGGFAEMAPTAIADADDARWAHNELLELGAEAGVPALALGLALLVWVFVWLHRGSGQRGAAIAAATLAASSAQAHIDYVWHFPAVLLALAAVVGAGATAGGTKRRSAVTPAERTQGLGTT